MCEFKIFHAISTTCGTCPLPHLASLSTASAIPSSTRKSKDLELTPNPSLHHFSGATLPNSKPNSNQSLHLISFGLPSSQSSLVAREFCIRLKPTSLLELCGLESATIHILSLRWGAPALLADNTPHVASYPTEAKSPRTTPSPREVRIGEFSTNTNRGRTSPTILAISLHNPLRSPSSPSPPPAQEMSWHGNPPDTTSTIPRHGFPSNVRTSSQIGNGCKHPSSCLALRTVLACSSYSTAQTHLHPSSLPPSIPPPAPAKSANSFNCSSIVKKVRPWTQARLTQSTGLARLRTGARCMVCFHSGKLGLVANRRRVDNRFFRSVRKIIFCLRIRNLAG
jgi:hypothetical protein